MTYEQVTWYLNQLARTYSHVELAQTRYSITKRKFYMVIIKPYRKPGKVRNPRQRRHRDSIWIESGFQANDFLNTATTLNLIHYWTTRCKINCDKDYYIV